jgi:hypothetical protein
MATSAAHMLAIIALIGAFASTHACIREFGTIAEAQVSPHLSRRQPLVSIRAGALREAMHLGQAIHPLAVDKCAAKAGAACS